MPDPRRLCRLLRFVGMIAFAAALVEIQPNVCEQPQAAETKPTADSSLYQNFGQLPVGPLSPGFVGANFIDGGSASFKIISSSSQRVVGDDDGKAQDILYFKSSQPQASVEETYSFVYSGPTSVVEPFIVNAASHSGLAGFSVNLTESSAENRNAGQEFYQYLVGAKQVERSIKGRLRTAPYFYSLGATYRVDTILDYQAHIFSTRVYRDDKGGSTVFDESIKVGVGHDGSLSLYPGLINPEGGHIRIRDFAFGSASVEPTRPHNASRALDYTDYLGYNAAIRGATTTPSSIAFRKYFPLLGIKHVRVPAEGAFLPTINSVSAFGINADVLTGRNTSITSLRSFISGLDVPPDSIELWNEPNNTSEGSAYDSSFRVDLPSFAQALRAAYPSATIWGPSILPDLNGFPSVAQGLASSLNDLISGWNSHPYALSVPEGTGYGGFIGGACGASQREDCGWYGAANWNQNVSAVLNPKLAGVSSEGGASFGSYPAICGHSNVSLVAQQAYIERGMLYYFKLGYLRLFPYKLLDDGRCSDGFGTYGIISRLESPNGQTEFSPKPAYTSIVYLNRLLRDNGKTDRQPPKALTFGLSGMTPDIEYLLLSESDGSHRLIFWSDLPLWDFNINGPHAIGKDLPIVTRNVTISFQQPMVLRPFTQMPGVGIWAASTEVHATSLRVPVTQLPMVVDIRIRGSAPAHHRLLDIKADIPTPGPTETASAARQ